MTGLMERAKLWMLSKNHKQKHTVLRGGPIEDKTMDKGIDFQSMANQFLSEPYDIDRDGPKYILMEAGEQIHTSYLLFNMIEHCYKNGYLSSDARILFRNIADIVDNA